MPKSRECPALSQFGSDLKQARKALNMTRRELAQKANIATRYLANIENSGSLPSLPIFYELILICHLPVENYFIPASQQKANLQLQRTISKLNNCDEKYLQIIESAIDGALSISAER